MSSERFATGAHTTLAYNADGLSGVTDDRGDVSAFAYNSSTDQLASWTYGSGTSVASHWSASYDSATQTSITDGNSHTAVCGPTFEVRHVRRLTD